MLREREKSPVSASDPAAELREPEQDAGTQFSSAGPLPGVAEPVELAMLSPSDRAYGRPAPERDDEERDPLSANGKIMERTAERDGAAIEEASKRYGIPEIDILAIITQESRGVATANAGASQKDRGRNAASGLMQVTHDTWKNTQRNHPELAKYPFASYRYDRRVNILVGTAALADKIEALERLGVRTSPENATAIATMAYNAGEGIVAEAYRRAVDGGSTKPDEDCLRPEYLKPAIGKYPSVYSYYLTGGGKSRNPQRSKQKAIDLKYQEISKYPNAVEMLVAEAEEHDLATEDIEVAPDAAPTQLASVDDETTRREA